MLNYHKTLINICLGFKFWYLKLRKERKNVKKFMLYLKDYEADLIMNKRN